jgi:hypothetical protein
LPGDGVQNFVEGTQLPADKPLLNLAWVCGAGGNRDFEGEQGQDPLLLVGLHPHERLFHFVLRHLHVLLSWLSPKMLGKFDNPLPLFGRLWNRATSGLANTLEGFFSTDTSQGEKASRYQR